MAKILIVEDDVTLAGMLYEILALQQYVIEQVHDGAAGLERLRSYHYDLIILDWNLPSVSGVEICRQHKASRSATPVMMLTSMARLEDKEKGFDAGADDYVSKPINVKDFAARVRALLRRSIVSGPPELRYKDLVLHSDSGRVKSGDRQIELPPKESELLQLLMRQPGEHLSTEALIARLWGADGTRASLANCLKRLRQKLEQVGEPELIETVPGLGYRLR